MTFLHLTTVTWEDQANAPASGFFLVSPFAADLLSLILPRMVAAWDPKPNAATKRRGAFTGN